MPHVTTVGRDNELTQLTHLTSPGAIVTVLGSAGAGKSHLVRAWAEPQGVAWADLGRAVDEEDLRSAVASALLGRSQDTPLVLDGADGVTRLVPATVERLRRAGFEGPILVTARDVTGTPGELVLALAPLRVPRDGDDGAGNAAVALVLAGRPGDRAEAAELARLVDGLPLLLLLLAGGGELADARRAVDRRLDEVRLSGRRLDRMALIREVLRWAWDASTDGERTLWTALSEAPPDLPWATIEATAAGLGDPDAAEGLRRRNLLQPHLAPGSTGWSLPARVRETEAVRRPARAALA